MHAISVPRGFKKVSSAPGVELYQKRRDFVQVVDLSTAKLHILHGEVLPQGMTATFRRRGIADWWAEWKQAHPQAFSVINGQFFDPSDPASAPLAFSIKTDGTVYQGYGDVTEFPFKKKILALYPGRAVISDYDDDIRLLKQLPAKNILVGLSPRASKALERPLPRTFMGIAKTGELLIFSSSMASQRSADRTLRMFGADPEQTMMLDGGTSSHLVQGNKMLVPSTPTGKQKYSREKLPQIVAIEAGL